MSIVVLMFLQTGIDVVLAAQGDIYSCSERDRLLVMGFYLHISTENHYIFSFYNASGGGR